MVSEQLPAAAQKFHLELYNLLKIFLEELGVLLNFLLHSEHWCPLIHWLNLSNVYFGQDTDVCFTHPIRRELFLAEILEAKR